jgi:hypothetical protein
MRAWVDLLADNQDVTWSCLRLSWPGKKDSRADSRSNKVFGRISYEMQTSVKGKSARLCFCPGQLRRKQLYIYLQYMLMFFSL